VDNRPIERADDMPILYRIILDGVAELERYDRPRATRIRRAAIHAYSTSWDRTQYGRLDVLNGQLQGRLERHRRPTPGEPAKPVVIPVPAPGIADRRAG
jgi:hypothetical protein